MNILDIRDVTISAPHKILCDQVSFSISQSEKVGLVARNGAGKSTLLKAIAGEVHIEGGVIEVLSTVRLGYLSQLESFLPTATVLDTLFSHDSEIGQVIKEYESALSRNDNAQCVKLVQKIDELQGRDYETNVNIVINKLQLQGLLDQKIEKCSGGELKRLALAKLLIDDPDFLILDEPTNHLDIEMIERLEVYLKRSKRTIFLVTHDRYFLERLCGRILELEGGKIYSYPGNYSKYLEGKEKREEIEEKTRHEMKQIVKKELEWMRKAPRARETKSVKREKDFLVLEDTFKSLKAQGRQSIKKIEIAHGERRIGGKIITLHNVYKSFDTKQIVENFSYSFRKGERIGLIGKNGVGKSTFINLLMDIEPVDSGQIKRGDTITMSLYQQKQPNIDESKRVIDVVREVSEFMTDANGSKISASKLLEQFLFPPKQQYQRAHTLSGGERRRLNLLCILMGNPNFLILDEPTNDLDITTLSILEDFLLAYKGCLVVVSHDRFFMDRVVDHCLVFAGDGIINEFPGGYSDWTFFEEELKKRESEQKSDDTNLASVSHESNSSNEETKKLINQQAEKKKSLSNKEREEYAFLGEEIERLETRKEAINLELSSGTLDHKAIKNLSAELAQIAGKLDIYEHRWLELAERG